MNTSMNQPISLYLNSLMNVDWQSTETFDFPNETTKEWLMEQGISSVSLNPDTVIDTWLKLGNVAK